MISKPGHRRLFIRFFLLTFLLLMGVSHGTTIILVTSNPVAQQEYIAFLEEVFGEGVSITAGAYTALNDNPGMLAELEAADLIVIARMSSSGEYINGTEIGDWNGLSTPILCHSAYLTRQSRWNWMAGDRKEETLTETRVVDSTDPVFKGMNVHNGESVRVFANPTVIDVQDNAGNGALVGSSVGNGAVLLNRWTNTDVLYHSDSPYKPAGPRLFFGLNESDPMGTLSEQGRMLLKNALLSLATKNIGGTVTESQGNTWVQAMPARSDSFSVVLDEPPFEAVNVRVIPSSNAGRIQLEGAAEPGQSMTLVFTPSDWNSPQNVILHAAQDALSPNTADISIQFETQSADAQFNKSYIRPVSVTVFKTAANLCPPEDITGDCQTDIEDLLLVACNWLDDSVMTANLNKTGAVDLEDLILLSQNWLEQIGPVVISEFMASNKNTILDGNEEASDWIELYNMTDVPVAMEGWYLTDNAKMLNKWRFPAGVVIEPYGYYLLFASSKDDALYPYVDNRGTLHTNFSLSADGEYLALVAPDEQTAISAYTPTYPMQTSDLSYGLSGMQNLFFAEVTPLYPNSAATYEDLVSAVQMSRPRGIYTAPFEVSISCPTEGATIYYTTDGKEPTLDSTAYTGPLTISTTTCLRAAAFKPGWYNAGGIATQTYLFPADVLTQSAPGDYPTEWSGYPADYGMDPEVYSDPNYAGVMNKALRSLPTLSIVMDKDALFDPAAGIYQNPTQSTVLWERPASVEFLDPNGIEEGFQVDCGLRIQGGASRQPNNSPKHSLRLLFKSIYGASKLEYPLFGKNAADAYDTLVLRANYNNSWYHWEPVQRLRTQYQRDQWARDTQLAMGRTSAHGRYVHLYLNGLYWGLYNIAERPEASFSASYFGGDKTEWDALNKGIVVDGDNVRWNQAISIAEAGISDDAGYAALSRYVDIPNLIDYLIINFYGGNQDWGVGNWYAAAKRQDGCGFKFFCWDTERTLEDPTGHNVTGIDAANSPARLYARLRQNPEFRMLFADRTHRFLFNNGVLTPDACIARWRNRAAQIDLPVIAESARWGDYRRDVHVRGDADLYTRNTHWVAEQNRLLTAYFPVRTNTVIGQLRNANLYPTTEAPVFSINGLYQYGGYVSSGDVLTMTHPNAAGTLYYTLDGSDPRLPGGEVNASALTYTAAVTVTQTVLVKARVLNNGIWSALSEATYTRGPAVLVHYWSFNPADTLLSPMFSSTGGAGLAIQPGATTIVTSGDGQDFAGLNSRLDEPVGTHLRVNNPLGAAVTLSVPTTGYEQVVLTYETRRSGQGAGQQSISYALDGQTFVPFGTITVLDAAPVLQTFDFSGISDTNDNPHFAVKIEFTQAAGGTGGNNRFDNMAIDAIPIAGVPQP